MSLADWDKIKKEIYYCDGSLRDIYVMNTKIEDWGKWIDLVNQKYQVKFYNGQTQQTENKIDKEIVLKYLNGETDLLNNAAVHLEKIIIMCYFFSDTEIENDINPKEITAPDDHDRLMSYLVDVSKTLDKRVILTAESALDQKFIYISVDHDNIHINLTS